MQGERPPAHVRDHDLGDARVVPGEVQLGQARVREEHPVGVADRDRPASRPDGVAHSRTTSSAALSSRSPRKRGWRRRPSRVHSVKPTCATRRGSTQVASALAHRVGERRVVPAQRRQQLGQLPQRGLREAGADLARVAQPAVLVVAQQQRAQLGPAPPRRGVAADHELLLGRALELEPVAGPAVRVGGVGALGDQALPALPARLAEELLAVAVAVRGQANRPAERERAPQQALARPQGQRGGVVPGQMEQVEDVQEHRDLTLAALLQPREARLLTLEGHDLPVHHEAPGRVAVERGDDLGEARVEAQAVARHQPGAGLVLDRHAPDPVELALVDPVRIREGLVGEHGLHRLDALGQRSGSQQRAVVIGEAGERIHGAQLPTRASPRDGRNGQPAIVPGWRIATNLAIASPFRC